MVAMLLRVRQRNLLIILVGHALRVSFFASAAVAEGETTPEGGSKRSQQYLRADPDTTCSDAYHKSPTKETCLGTKDHFRRPCSYCVDSSDLTYCYNADQAKWARLFREKCETGPEAKVK